MAQAIRVRDVAREGVHEFGPSEQAFRVPYDLFHPEGAVHMHGELIEWSERGHARSARVVPALLGDTHPGERVLLRLSSAPPDDEWWLCDVEAINGSAATR